MENSGKDTGLGAGAGKSNLGKEAELLVGNVGKEENVDKGTGSENDDRGNSRRPEEKLKGFETGLEAAFTVIIVSQLADSLVFGS